MGRPRFRLEDVDAGVDGSLTIVGVLNLGNEIDYCEDGDRTFWKSQCRCVKDCLCEDHCGCEDDCGYDCGCDNQCRCDYECRCECKSENYD